MVYTSVMNTNSFPNVREKVPLAFLFSIKTIPSSHFSKCGLIFRAGFRQKKTEVMIFQDFFGLGNSKVLLYYQMNTCM